LAFDFKIRNTVGKDVEYGFTHPVGRGSCHNTIRAKQRSTSEFSTYDAHCDFVDCAMCKRKNLDFWKQTCTKTIMTATLPPAMARALEEARAAALRNEVPVGAVVLDEKGAILCSAGNRTLELHDPTAHAEILAIRQAGQLRTSERLIDCTLYITLEPCAMCAAAISFARLKRIVFAAEDPKMGAIVNGPRFFDQPACNHKPEVISGIGEAPARKLLLDFFKSRR
jgi:tRNA(adenine34) deaminase